MLSELVKVNVEILGFLGTLDGGRWHALFGHE